MTREELAHALRSMSAITGRRQFNIIGSQSILGSYSEGELPSRATLSPDLDVYVPNDPDGVLTEKLHQNGVGSDFEMSFGFHLDPVDPYASNLPAGWEERVVSFEDPLAPEITAICLDPYDLCASKLIANRDQDREFVGELIMADLIDTEELQLRMFTMSPRNKWEDYAQGAAFDWIAMMKEEVDRRDEQDLKDRVAQLRQFSEEMKSASISKDLCGIWMPLAKRWCGKVKGHAGHC